MCWLQQSAQLWHYPTFLLYPLLLVGGIECFAGYHAWRFLLGLNGAVFGFIAGAMLSVMLGASLLVLIGALAGAVLAAMLFAAVAPLGSAVFTFSSAASFTILVGRVAGAPHGWYVMLAGVVGTAGAVAALAMRRAVMICLTAIAGAQQVACAWTAYHMLPDSTPVPDMSISSEWCAFSVLAIAGLIIQFTTTRQIPPD